MKRIARIFVWVSVITGVILIGLAFGTSTLAKSGGNPLPQAKLNSASQQTSGATPAPTMPPMDGMPGMDMTTSTPAPTDTSGMNMAMGDGSATPMATMSATMAMGNMPGMELDSCVGQPITPADQTAVDQLVAQVKTDAARFADYTVAVAEGYKQSTPFPVPGKNGKWGPAHFLNAAYIIQDVVAKTPINPDKPGSLVYFRMPNGKMMLLGEMFLAPRGKGTCLGGGLTVWHNHSNLCFANGSANVVGVTNAQGNCPAGSTNRSTMDMLHVWVFDNPDGPLAMDLNKQDYTAVYLQCMGGSPWCQ